MLSELSSHRKFIKENASLQNLPRILLAPLPVFPMQPALNHIVKSIADKYPELFDRLGPHTKTRYLIDPVNMPFVFMLIPDPEKPVLRVLRRSERVKHDARIAGTFLKLLDMMDARTDGDSLFFTRDLIVEGNTEAVVTLRNALDDIEGNMIDDIAASFGLFSVPMSSALGILRKIRNRQNDN